MSVLGVIPARGQSRRFPRKHLARVGGATLIQHAIRVAHQCPSLGRIVFSSEDAEYLDHARAAGCETIERPAELADESLGYTDFDALRHAAQELGFHDHVVCMYPTAPFRRYEHVERTLAEHIRLNADITFSMRHASPNPHWLWSRDQHGWLSPLKINGVVDRTTRAPICWQTDGLAYAVTYDALMDGTWTHWESGRPKRVQGCIVTDSDWDRYDIDYAWQVDVAEKHWAPIYDEPRRGPLIFETTAMLER